MAEIEDPSSRRYEQIAKSIEADRESSSLSTRTPSNNSMNILGSPSREEAKITKGAYSMQSFQNVAVKDTVFFSNSANQFSAEDHDDDLDLTDVENGDRVIPRGAVAIARISQQPTNDSRQGDDARTDNSNGRTSESMTNNSTICNSHPLVAELVPSLDEQRETLRDEIRQELREELQQSAASRVPSMAVEAVPPTPIEVSVGHSQVGVVRADPVIQAEVSDRNSDANYSMANNKTQREVKRAIPKRKRVWACIAIVGFIMLAVIVVVVLLLRRDGENNTNQQGVNAVAPTAAAATTTTPSPTELRTKLPTSNPSNGPSFSPTIIEHDFIDEPIWAELEPILSGPPTFTSNSILADPKSMPYQTLTWMINNDMHTQTILSTPPSALRTQKLLDRYILAFMYFSLDGRNWNNRYNFMSEFDVCKWNDGTASLSNNGVRCDDDGIVTSIALFENKLEGELPLELYHLEKLSDLQLDTNLISGTISSHIRTLQNLQRFWIGSTLLSGTIPTEVGMLAQLEDLFLYDNALRGTIPTEIGNCELLLGLQVNLNDVEGAIPSEVGKLMRLVEFTAYRTTISGTVPTEVGLLTHLTQLKLQETHLNGTIPSEIGKMTSLEGFYAHRAQFTGSIPTEVGNCKAIKYFEVNGNDLNGTIPTEIGHVRDLRGINLSFNSLTGAIPTEIGQLVGLNQVSFSQTNLRGTVPTELGMLTALVYLALDNTLLTGTIPTHLGALSSLDGLYFDSSGIYGDFDPIFCDAPGASSIPNFWTNCGEDNVTCTCCTKCCRNDVCEEN